MAVLFEPGDDFRLVDTPKEYGEIKRPSKSILSL
jgi:hypothetical protein